MRQREGAEVMDQIMKERVDLLEQWIRESDNVVFTINSMIIRRKPSSAIAFTGEIRKSFTGFIKIRCCFRKRNPMRHIWP